MKRSSDGGAGGASKRRRASILVEQLQHLAPPLGDDELLAKISLASKALAKNVRTAALWREGKFCDVQLRVGSELFPAHRLVLAAASDYFAARFDGQFKDALEPIVDILEMEPHVFALALDYMYDSSCSVPDVSTLQQVLSVASVLQIDSLLIATAIALDKNLNVDNCASMLACATQHHVPQLLRRAEALAREAFVDVASNPAFPASSMLALLQSDRLIVTSEEQVFETLSTWLKAQVEPLGEDEQLQMFGLVHLTLLSQDFRDSTVMAEPVFSTLRARNLLRAQFQAELLSGKKPTKRGNPPSQILSAEAHRQILVWLDTGAATKLELLYRASYDGWEGRDFHLRCDNKGPTVTVIKCTDSYVFGGFTSTPWASINKSAACADAFIFSLHRPGSVSPVKLAVNYAQSAIYDSCSYGPRFGHTDIEVQSGANGLGSTGISYYALPQGHAPVDALTFFTGAKNFRAAEVEVLRVLA